MTARHATTQHMHISYPDDTVPADCSTVVRCQILFIRIEFDFGRYSIRGSRVNAKASRYR